MPLDERKAHWQALNAGVVRDDVNAWRDAFVEQLKAVGKPARLVVA